MVELIVELLAVMVKILCCVRAADLRHGHWTKPYFDCKGFVKKWVTTYAAPFFGWDSLRAKLEFKGVVTVTMDLQMLDINQCPGQYYTPNAFKDTNKCDTKTSYVSSLLLSYLFE